jgi:VWFA-related protein
LEDVYAAARLANTAIYALDPRGQVAPENSVRGGISAIANERTRRRLEQNLRHQQNYLARIALNTGGRSFTNQSSVSRAVQEIVAENGSYYLLRYAPDPLVRDGKFHRIEVTVKRAGVHLRSRPGYFSPRAADAERR